MSGSPVTRGGDPVTELYRSLLDGQRHARQRMLSVRSIERRYRDTPLTDLAALAASGALHQLTPDRQEMPL